MEYQWSLLAQIQRDFTQIKDLPGNLNSALASRLDEAITHPSRTELDGLAKQLDQLQRQMLQSSAQVVRQGIIHKQGEVYQAYRIGQFNFAQLLASQSANLRVDDEFEQHLHDERYASYVQALLKRPMTNKELADACLEEKETVSRKLRFLREIGATDFRKEGTHTKNFLMPAARSLLQNNRDSIKPPPQIVAIASLQVGQNILARLKEATSPHFQHGQSFASVRVPNSLASCV